MTNPDFRPRDLSTAALKQRKLLRKQTRRYTNFSIRYKKNLNTSKIELEKTIVAVKTLKGIFVFFLKLMLNVFNSDLLGLISILVFF